MKRENKAEYELVVGSLKVLKDTSGSGMEKIKRSIEAVNQNVNSFIAKQDRYWDEVASDNIITPVEKAELKREYNIIEQTYTSIIAAATAGSILLSDEIQDYIDKYSALRTYLFSTLKVFDIMSENTIVGDPSEFNKMYKEYYDSEFTAQKKVTSNEAAGVRKLSSLYEAGSEDEVAIYNGIVYVYKSGTWIKANTEDYLGVYKSATPDNKEGCYFLCGQDFLVVTRLRLSKGFLKMSDGKRLATNITFKKGKIYLCNGPAWKIIENKDDWRYIVATNDLVDMNENISPSLETATVGKVYEETGIAKLEDKLIIDEETGLIKAKLIDVEKIKAKEGFFDNVSAHKGTYEEITIKKAVLNKTFLRLSNQFTFQMDDEQTGSKLIADLEAARSQLYTDYGALNDVLINGSCTIFWAYAYSENPQVYNQYISACSPALRITVSETHLLFEIENVVLIHTRGGDLYTSNMTLSYDKTTNKWRATSDNRFIDLPPTNDYISYYDFTFFIKF